MYFRSSNAKWRFALDEPWLDNYFWVKFHSKYFIVNTQMYKVMRTNESRVLYVILFTTSQCIMAKNRYIMFYACDIITLIEGKHDAGFKSSASFSSNLSRSTSWIWKVCLSLLIIIRKHIYFVNVLFNCDNIFQFARTI